MRRSRRPLRTGGAGHLRISTRIVLPLSKPLIVVLLSVAPTMVLFLVLQRQVVQGFTRSNIR